MLYRLFNRLKRELNNIDRRRIEKRCGKIKCIGKTFGNSYGGYTVAVDQIEAQKEINVLSFGIGEDLSFSSSLLEYYPNARVFAFDPTPRAIEYVGNNRLMEDERFRFFSIGISSLNGKQKFYFPQNKEYVSCSTYHQNWVGEDYTYVNMKTFDKILENIQINDIAILKMDIEGSEFDVMESILDSGIEIKQICVEVHDYLFEKNIGKEKLEGFINLLSNSSYRIARVAWNANELTFVKC